jgi:ABC-type transport system involved in cytochrome c biogenesis permease subunit
MADWTSEAVAVSDCVAYSVAMAVWVAVAVAVSACVAFSVEAAKLVVSAAVANSAIAAVMVLFKLENKSVPVLNSLIIPPDVKI